MSCLINPYTDDYLNSSLLPSFFASTNENKALVPHVPLVPYLSVLSIVKS